MNEFENVKKPECTTCRYLVVISNGEGCLRTLYPIPKHNLMYRGETCEWWEDGFLAFLNDLKDEE